MVSTPQRLLIVVGAQRSGTTMVLEAFARSPHTEVHGEASSAVMHDHRLVSVECLQEALSRSQAKEFVIKPLCDSQWVDVLLGHFDGSRAIWMFRDWRDVVNSMVRKWPEHAVDTIGAFARGDDIWLGWRSERITSETKEKLDELCSHVASDVAAAAVVWWLRNQHFFDRCLQQHPEVVRPLRYELLVQDSAQWLERAVRFAGFRFEPSMVDEVHANSVSRFAPPVVPEAISRVCDRMLADLTDCAEAAWSLS